MKYDDFVASRNCPKCGHDINVLGSTMVSDFVKVVDCVIHGRIKVSFVCDTGRISMFAEITA